MTLLSAWLGDVWSNTPLDDRLRVPAPAGAHVCLDLGEEEFTKGRPHPMIDAEAGSRLLREAGGDGDVAVVLLDVVLGYGAHDDPAAVLAPACASGGRPGGPRSSSTSSAPTRIRRASRTQRRAFAEAGGLVRRRPPGPRCAAAAIAGEPH